MKIIGSGMIATAFGRRHYKFPDEFPNAIIYAAGVSNSAATDERDFERESARIQANFDETKRFVYFSTWGASHSGSPYQKHKFAMEQLIAANQPDHLIVRLPIVAGRTSNPHTLLNYLYNAIVRSERFVLWTHAQRSIIDVDDVVKMTCDLLETDERRQNFINDDFLTMHEIVEEFCALLGKKAVCDIDERPDKAFYDMTWNYTLMLPKRHFLHDLLRKYYPR